MQSLLANEHRRYAGALVALGVLLLGMALWVSEGQAQGPTPTPTPTESAPPAGELASPAQIAAAYAAWLQSEHAATYDDGLGADTTCARCKSPFNWDPTHPAAEAALDCASCKRIPGEPRPTLEGGDPVPEAAWQHIGCPVCHEPVGDTYRVAPAFWNQERGVYEAVASSEALCAHCHEGRHGFEVAEEVHADDAHPGWGCLDCHDPHGGDVRCEDCHDPYTGPGAEEHLNHPEVHCSACHDQGGLALWRERNADSPYYGQVITIRFAHTLTAWPSHNLQAGVDCRRCHHPADLRHPALAQEVACDNASCHPGGAVLNWCPFFDRDS